MHRGCELCDSVACLYCSADEAYICWTCDAKVHGANFLVARHTRSVLCGTCGISTPWRISGANPTPLTGFCTDCSQGESQGECTTYKDGTVLDSRRVALRLIPGVVERSDSVCESGCSSSIRKICEGVEGVEGTLPPSLCASSLSQLSSGDMGSNRSDQASPSSGICQSLKRKRSFECCSGESSPQSKQIATRTTEDVKRTATHSQCECDSVSSSSLGCRTSPTHAHQDPFFETRDCIRSQPQAFRSSSRALTTLLTSSTKRHRMEDRTQMRPSFPRNQQQAVLSTSRLMRMLAKWHWDLHLSSPGTVPLALRIFRKATRTMALDVLSSSGVRVTLAACLRLAAAFDEAQITVPKASEVAACARVSTRKLVMTEIQLLAILRWRRCPIWAGVRR